jgi:hypothetical protein
MLIQLSDYRRVDPALRVGDNVRLCFNDCVSPFTVEDFGFGIDNPDVLNIDLNGLTGLVTCVEATFDDGQAEYVTVAIPFEEGWETFEEIHISNIRRIISKEFNAIRNLQ